MREITSIEAFLTQQRRLIEDRWLDRAGKLEKAEYELKRLPHDAHEGALRQATSCALLRDKTRLVPQVAELEEALVRLDAGTYGLCQRCGRGIGEARLEHQPEARYCVGCASWLSRHR